MSIISISSPDNASRVVALETLGGDSNLNELQSIVLRFIAWLDRYGETSYDHQSFFASALGRSAKLLYYRYPRIGTFAVAPMIFCEAFLPSARALFWHKQRFPIADAHYAMGFAFLSRIFGNDKYYRRAVHFLEVLEATRCPGHELYCWGYPFDWETRRGTIRQNTPLITTVPYVYEAFRAVYLIDGRERWRGIMRSIAEHAFRDYRDFEISSKASSCAYTPEPGDPGGVINASAYRAFLLSTAAYDFSEEAYRRAAEKNLNFVLESQNKDGSWNYATDGERNFVDHFHTCFVLKALSKIEALTGNTDCTAAIASGVGYYIQSLFDGDGLPKPFSRRPRLTVYRRELYDYAECINLATLLKGRFPRLDQIRSKILNLKSWRQPSGSFRARQLLVGWDNTPMHRWAQSQMFRSLCFVLDREQIVR
ncbi:MAG: hypothetical protein ACJ746_18360 [Bryobacteraceae bacterium]